METGTFSTDGWAICFPSHKDIRYDTFKRTRKESIIASGCSNSKKWKYLYSKGYRVVKVSAEYDLN